MTRGDFGACRASQEEGGVDRRGKASGRPLCPGTLERWPWKTLQRFLIGTVKETGLCIRKTIPEIIKGDDVNKEKNTRCGFRKAQV